MKLCSPANRGKSMVVAVADSRPREVLNVRVFGIPKAQPRPRAFAKPIGGGKFSARMYESGTAEAWKSDVARAVDAVWDGVRLTGPVLVDITLIFQRPKDLSRRCDPDGRIYHWKKPDRDNCDKAVLDCLMQLGMWGDDGQVCDGSPKKVYAAKGERPGAEIVVSVLAARPDPRGAGTPGGAEGGQR